jgi:hypothetical protein
MGVVRRRDEKSMIHLDEIKHILLLPFAIPCFCFWMYYWRYLSIVADR